MIKTLKAHLAGIKHNLIDSERLHAKWEQIHLKKLLHYLNVDCVFDIGANKGQYAEMLRKKANFKGYIFSFEPNPDDAAILRKRAEYDDKWIISELAISDKDGTTEFNVMKSSQFSSLSKPSHDEVKLFEKLNVISKTITVKTETLESTLRHLQSQYKFLRPFLKMDTQGYDINIVRGSPTAVQEFLGLQSELAISKLYVDSVDFREALTEYENLGFKLSALVPNNAGHFPIIVEADCIMVRSDLAQTKL